VRLFSSFRDSFSFSLYPLGALPSPPISNDAEHTVFENMDSHTESLCFGPPTQLEICDSSCCLRPSYMMLPDWLKCHGTRFLN
jgi:hypothetical protein